MPHVLTSWKEIAQYLGKGVRTVQRWEREMGLPVRRPKPKEKHIVLAFCEELDFWVRNNSQAAAAPQTRSQEVRRLKELVANMSAQTRKMHASVTVLTERATRHEHLARRTSTPGDGKEPEVARTEAPRAVPATAVSNRLKIGR